MIKRPAIGARVKVRDVQRFRHFAGRLGKVVAHHVDGVAFGVALDEPGDRPAKILLVDPSDVDLAEVPA